jgi:MFS transporter, ACS family, hexuronate transporter
MRENAPRIVATVSLWHVAASTCYYGLYVATPYLREGFGASHTEVGLVLGVLSLGYALSLLPVGSAIDARGERVALVVGLIGLSVGALVLPFAPSLLVLAPIAFGIGAAYATASPGTNRAILLRVPPERRNLAMGIKQVGVTVGSAGSALVLTWFAGTHLGWAGGFVAVGLLGLGVTALFALTYPRGEPVDRSDPPSFRGLLSRPAFRSFSLAGLFLGAMSYTTTGYVVLYLTESVALSVGLAGVILAATQVSGSVGRVASGWLADTLSGSLTRRTTTILLSQTVLGALALLALPVVDSLLATVLALLAVGVTALGLGGIYFSAVGALVEKEEVASASSASQLTLTLGGLAGPPAFGLLVDLSGYRAGWWLLAGSGLVAAALLVLALSRASPDGAHRPGGSR